MEQNAPSSARGVRDTLKGRQLYPDPVDAKIHDAIKAMNDKQGGPLAGHILMLGVGAGKVAQAGLAQEIRALVKSVRALAPADADALVANLDKFLPVYIEEVARVFADVWTSKKHSVRSGIALRAFVQAAQPVAAKVLELGGAPRTTVRAMLAPWESRIGGGRFETAGAWRAKAAGGGKETTRVLARELVAALGEPGGPA